jgi:hypothetical protein
MHGLKLFIAGLVLVPIFASGCSKAPPPVSRPSRGTVDTVQRENAQPPADSGGGPAGVGQAVSHHSNAGEQVSAGTQATASAPAPLPLMGDIPVQNLDSRLQEALRNYHITAGKIDRSIMASDMVKLADAGVPQQQLASALGYMFRDENSVEVKTDILNELGDLNDPSAFDQIVRALDQRQPDEVRVAAIEALDSLGDKRAIPVLQPLLADRDEDVRDAAQTATDSLNDQ